METKGGWKVKNLWRRWREPFLVGVLTGVLSYIGLRIGIWVGGLLAFFV